MPTGTYVEPVVTRTVLGTVKTVGLWESEGTVKGVQVTDTNGYVHKVSDKREIPRETFQIGTEIKFSYSKFKGNEYVLTAEATGKRSVVLSPEDDTPPDPELQPKLAAPKPEPKPVIMPEHKFSADPKNRSFALAYSSQLWGKRLETGMTCSDIDVIATATLFCAYLDNGAIVEKKV